jgi:uncharacterized integral membrane protein (TIGR00697 family)
MRRNSPQTSFETGLVLITGFLVIQFTANLTASKTTPLFGGALAIPVGSLLYAVSFTWIDLINEKFGRSRARRLVIASIIANVAIVLWFQFYIHLPGTESWNDDPVSQAAIERVLGGLGRISAASIIVSFVVDNVDITLYHLIRTRWPKVQRWGASAISNTLSGPLDAVLFSLLALYGTMSFSALARVVYGGVLFKLSIGWLSSPLVYIIRTRSTIYNAESTPPV